VIKGQRPEQTAKNIKVMIFVIKGEERVNPEYHSGSLQPKSRKSGIGVESTPHFKNQSLERDG